MSFCSTTIGLTMASLSTTSSTSVLIPALPDQLRVVPVAAIQCALFRVGGTKGRRELIEALELSAAGGRKITFSGIELRDDDLDVLMAIFSIAGGTQQDGATPRPIRFSGLTILGKLDWGNTGFYYKKLADCLNRLQRASIRISFTDEMGVHRFLQGNLISKFAGAQDEFKSQFSVSLDLDVCRWLALDKHTLVWPERKRLSRPLAKWLHAFISTFRDSSPEGVFAAPEVDLLRQCGSSAQSMRTFRASLKEALDQMLEEQLIYSYKIRDGIVYVFLTEESTKQPFLFQPNSAAQQYQLAFDAARLPAEVFAL